MQRLPRSILAVLICLLPLCVPPASSSDASDRVAPNPLLLVEPALPAGPTRILPTSSLSAQPSGQVAALTGWFSIVWGDGEPRSNSETQKYLLTDDAGQTTQLWLNESLAVPLGGVLALNGRRVTVTGVWLAAPASVNLNTLQVESVQFAVNSLPAPLEVQGPQVSGSQPWLSILCKFADVITETKPITYFQNMYGSAYPGLDHYWRQVSFNIINTVGSGAVGWYTLPQPRSYYVYDQNSDGKVEADLNRLANDCTGVADPYIYFPTYVGVNLMFNSDLDSYAWGGNRYMTLDGVTRSWRVTWEPPWGYKDITVIAHEMGHGFGLPHSSGMYGQTYDNQWDVMSDTWSNCSSSRDAVYGCLGQHTISYHKDMLGWISASNKITVTPGNQAMVTLEQLALPQTGNPLMARIPVQGSNTKFYTVEARRKVGYDVKLPGQAVIIHEVDTTRGIPAHVVDVDGNGNTGDAGAMWLPGEVFSDTVNGITVTVLSTTTTGFVVSIANRFAYGPVMAAFTASPTSGLRPLNVTFTNQSTGNYSSLSWSFGDGITSTLANPAHTYAMTGTFAVTLTVTGLGGSDIAVKPGYITVLDPQSLIYLPIVNK